MSLFDNLVDQAIRNQPDLAPLRPVVEKELLHQDILREMGSAGLLADLTFMGGTCLRACYGSNRLSEDLDFTGGPDFSRETLRGLADHLLESLERKYGLEVTVSKPVRETGNVDTWKLKVITRPERRDLPAQKIHIDICAVPSYQRRPMLLRNRYGVDMGTAELIIQVESREEILADKMVAFALRPNRVKARDLWDIAWLKQQGLALHLDLLPKKATDHGRPLIEFIDLLSDRARLIRQSHEIRRAFTEEMARFLPPKVVQDTIEKTEFWDYVSDLIGDECDRAIEFMRTGEIPRFPM